MPKVLYLSPRELTTTEIHGKAVSGDEGRSASSTRSNSMPPTRYSHPPMSAPAPTATTPRYSKATPSASRSTPTTSTP